MKHFLDLIPISAKVHRKQNRMSILCIILSVFLVTTIFGMADMFIRSQILQAQRDDGSWHIGLRNISAENAALMAARPDIAVISPYGTLNFGANLGYTMGGKETVIFGSEEALVTKIFLDMLTEGAYPQAEGGALVTENAREMMGLHIGDEVTLNTPDGTSLHFQITGFVGNSSGLMRSDAYGIFLCMENYRAIYPDVAEGEPSDFDIMYYVQFSSTSNIQGKIGAIKSAFQLSDGQVSENTKLLGLLGQSRDSFMMFIYAAAGILFVLVMSAGILMIASSLNSNVAQRMEFFGLMRCIGSTPRQVMQMVRREALGWCRLAIPAGVAAGIVVIWVLCAILRYLSPGYFSAMPAFGLSLPSVAAGVLVGLLTVMLAARSPAKRAAKVSPLAAVSGSAGEARPVRSAANTQLAKVDTALGIHHAVSSRKNYLLMTGSFALSIVLFLSFSVTVDFMRHALTPLQPWTPDLSIVSPDRTCSVDSALLERLNEIPAVKAAYGRMFAYGVPISGSDAVQTADLISYDANQFGWAEDYLLEGSLEAAQQAAGTGLVVKKSDSTIKVGDTITIQAGGTLQEIEIVGILSDCPFSNAAGVGLIICSEDSFRQMTGLTDFTVIDIQLVRGVSDSEVNAIHQMVGTQYTFSDERLGNSSTRGIYYCFNLFVYGFLVLIALITIFNVVNSIAMSVASRTKQYGAFRAIGLSTRQLSKMVVAEACSYAASGIVAGTVLGMLSNRLLFGMLIGQKWGEAWSIPWSELGVILLIILLSITLAVHEPIKRIHNMSIVDTISVQ
jgi:putative ABC transport system permease protein